MKENSPIWARPAEMVSAVPVGWPNARTITKAATDLPTRMMSKRREQRQRLAQHDRRIEQHADGDEEQHREGVAQRQRFLGRAAG